MTPPTTPRRSRRRIPQTPPFSASDFAMTGVGGPDVEDTDAPIPFYGTDDPIPFDLARGEGMAVWGGDL